jgi:Protein of unknown function (DUF2950)
MKESRRFVSYARIMILALVVGVSGMPLARLQAAEPTMTQPRSIHSQKLFASPEKAVNALQAAVKGKDNKVWQELFGPEFNELLTGDKVQDENNMKRFADALAVGCNLVKEKDDKIVLEVGENNWPMPIPLVKEAGQWRFDTAAGKNEIINRRIVKNELHAIGVCQAYVVAQRLYAIVNQNESDGVEYAQKFKSTSGKKDGLYWVPAEHEPVSPFGALVAEAQAEGYTTNKACAKQPFHGYYFRILTRQGKSAPGGELDYMSGDHLAGGFALVAYPERWNHSGIMTFIVNQDGNVYQRNLGENTYQIASEMKEYNPDSEWTLVMDQGVVSAVSKNQ